ncbi:MAG: phosphoenolpyruvate carboxykinase [Candidatus Omnitrophica bacterium]|nr:phosphoenolpyruvate carboxykinase [Candidatus Omnitrophota bacterium]
MPLIEYETLDRKIIIRIRDRICETPEELITSDLFRHIVKEAILELHQHDSYLLNIFPVKEAGREEIDVLIEIFQFLVKMKAELVPNVVKNSASLLKDKHLFNEFVEYLYNYWRNFDRFIICESAEGTVESRPYRIFNNTIEHLMHLVRAVYRDIQENITGEHPNIYRQVRAGAEIATIAVPQKLPFRSNTFKKLDAIPVIRQVLLYPPLILNPPMNKRTGKFEKISVNPLEKVDIDSREWLCYPAKVGPLVIWIYFHQKFAELGFSLCNLFELATGKDLDKKPDGVFCFGVPRQSLEGLGKSLTVFYEDTKNDVLIAACPSDDEFGYYGYLKKMVLTLHNVVMMKRGILPFHGALVRIILSKNKIVTVLLIGDTGAGKSETLEALREMGKDIIKDLIIIADDMGSIQIDAKGQALGYGTEIGAFLRLDDLKPGYAFGQMDRAIIMNPNKINARIVIPVTTFDKLIAGYPIDMVLYANNYEEVDEDHPIVERFQTVEEALKIFREGTVMSKGTTTSTGIVHSYFANVFGPTQYRELHDALASKYFEAFFKKKLYMGQFRTRLGIAGAERKGPEEAAQALLNLISK